MHLPYRKIQLPVFQVWKSIRSGHHVEITVLILQQHPIQSFHCREEEYLRSFP